MKNIFLFSFFLLFGQTVVGQEIKTMKGWIVSEGTSEAIPYVNVYNKTLKKGTITNTNGYFRLDYSSLTDSIVISQVGYVTTLVSLQPRQSYYSISLQESSYELEEVVIDPDKNAYLFEYITECRKKASNDVVNAKAYYELKSYSGSQQLELVEGYYNTKLAGYEIKDLELKAGRLALQPYENRIYTLKLTSENDYFPKTPVEISKKEARKTFNLAVEQRYKDEKNDSVYVISYWPKNDTGSNFEGQIWMNVTRFQVEKMTMNCSNCTVHPFLPLFPNDSISNVALNITKTFLPVNGKMVFNHVDFSYSVDYKSRVLKSAEFSYSITTNAVLYAYDFSQSFDLPKFHFVENVADYRKINALPYNSFFWENNDEYRLNDEQNRNEQFFLDSNSVTNITFFKSRNKGEVTATGEWKRSETPLSKRGYFEHPYIQWSGNRIFLREMIADSTVQAKLGSVNSLQYNLDVQIFFDVNQYKDSVNVLTGTVFDPYTTYYYLPIDQFANCFINMYFDWCEIQRRNWEAKRNPAWNADQNIREYESFVLQMEKQKAIFLKEVDRGTNRKAMEKWNAYIVNAIGIDNVALFKLYEEK